MNAVLLLIAGAIGGFLVHSITIKVGFKQRTIDNKIKVYDSLITQWVKMRNFIFANHPGRPIDNFPIQVLRQFDQMYGESQQYVGEAILVCEDAALTDAINNLNERVYRTKWYELPIDQANQAIEQIKADATAVIVRMRADIRDSTRFEWQDFIHIISGFGKKKTNMQ